MIQCGTCQQDFGDKGNAAKCRCSCHARLPLSAHNGTRALRWDFRSAQMVEIPDADPMPEMPAMSDPEDVAVQTFVLDVSKMRRPSLEEVRV